MRLYVVRHGESEANALGLWAGMTKDVHLTEKGREDAKKSGEILSRYHMDKVYTSSLSRAIETAKIAVPYLEPQIWPEINEQGIGVLEMMKKEDRDLYGKVLSSSLETRDFTPFGGEDRPTVQKRVWDFMKEMEGEDPDVFIAVFTHFWPIIEMFSYIEGRNLMPCDIFPKNSDIFLFNFRYGKWTIDDAETF